MTSTLANDAFPRGVIFDVDGTLYHQTPVRRSIAFKLMGQMIRHPNEFRLFRAMMMFRSLRETDAGRVLSEEEQIGRVANLCRTSTGRLRTYIQRWMFEEPLPIIKDNKNIKVLTAIALAREHGAVLCAYSDYRAEEKLNVLGIQPDFVFYPGHGIPNELKPSRTAMREIVRSMETDPRSVIYYGDRPEKDGVSASFEGIRYISVKR